MKNAGPDWQEALRALGKTEIDQLAVTIDQTGFAVLRNVISPATLDAMRGFIVKQLEESGGQYLGLMGPEWIMSSPLAPMLGTGILLSVLQRLYERATGDRNPSARIFTVLRILAGTRGLRHADRFHYDSYVVTALMPILIPDRPDELPGHLVMYPNFRRVRSNAFFNIFEKAVVENPLICKVWRLPFVQKILGAKTVVLEPGNLYFFWGMKSLHANRACLPTSVRSTALFHFGDPHERSVFKTFSKRRHEAILKRLDR